MSDTQSFDQDPVDALLSGASGDDPAARFAADLKQAASVDEPVRIDATLADLFAPPTPQARRSWRPWLILRPAATVAAAFVAVLMLGAGAVALVGPQLVDSTASEPTMDVADYGPVEISTDREIKEDVTVVDVVGAERSDEDRTSSDDEAAATSHEEKADANAVDEAAVLAWATCMEEAFDVWLAETFGKQATVPEGLMGTCDADTSGSLGVAGHEFKNAMKAWMACASEYGHNTLKAGNNTDLDVIGACGEVPQYGDFGIDVPDDADAKSGDRTGDMNRRSDELTDDRDRSGEGHDDGRGDVRNDSSDEGRPQTGDRTGEG